MAPVQLTLTRHNEYIRDVTPGRRNGVYLAVFQAK
jgi:hypothetical protein